MFSSRNKKSVEKRHFEYFRESCKELPAGIVDDDRENPDFLIKHGEGVLGIEHTQLFKITRHPNTPQALESFRHEIVESAQKLCGQDIPPLWVKVWFDFNQAVPKNRKPEIVRISRALAEFVKKWHEENPLRFRESFKLPSNVPTVFQMSITNPQNAKTGSFYHRWTVEGPALVQNLTAEKVQSCINEKNRRYEEYIEQCDECWLLIAVDTFKDSQSFDLPSPLDHRFESKFERVFCMDVSHRKDLHELPIIRI